ncbi:helix-turn-helix domain-containing protein [Emergencia timonensis]
MDRPLTERFSGYARCLIKSAFKKTDGNIARAAAVLGVPRQNLSRKAKE